MSQTNAQAFELKLFARLLHPSITSVAVSLLLALGTIGSVLLPHLYTWSGLNTDVSRITTVTDTQTGKSLTAYDQINDRLADVPFLASVPLFMFWAFVGLTAYYLVAGIVTSFSQIRKIEEELGYIHSNRREIIRTTLIRLLIRVAALAALVALQQVFVGVLLPYALAAAAAALTTTALNGTLYLVLSVAVLLCTFHVATILVRLIALKPRVFGGDIFDEEAE